MQAAAPATVNQARRPPSGNAAGSVQGLYCALGASVVGTAVSSEDALPAFKDGSFSGSVPTETSFRSPASMGISLNSSSRDILHVQESSSGVCANQAAKGVHAWIEKGAKMP